MGVYSTVGTAPSVPSLHCAEVADSDVLFSDMGPFALTGSHPMLILRGMAVDKT